MRVPRPFVREHLRQIINSDIKVVKTTLDVRFCRGMYLSPQNTTKKIVQQLGCHIVVLPREGNNYCWERFVQIKEYMHVFDTKHECTDTGEAFDGILADFTSAEEVIRSHQMHGEVKAFWRALAILCPEAERARIISERDERGAAEFSDYAIALRLRIPELYVPTLFAPFYATQLETILD